MKKKSRLGRRQISVVGTILVCLLLVVVAMPFYIMIVGTFKPTVNLVKIPVDLAPFTDFTWKNLENVFTKSDVFLWLKNSFIVSLSVAALTAFIAVTAGYAFAKIKFPGKNIFFALVMATMMMPKQMLMIPNYLVAYNLHLPNTLIGVILTTIAPAMGVFLSRQFISSLPGTLFDAAEIDGCSEPGKFFRITLPLAMPSVGTVSIFSFFTTFNDYIWQLIMISDKAIQTLPIGMSFFAQRMHANRGAQLAIAFVATVPLAIIFVAGQKFFIKGATVGAVKG